MFNAKIGSCPYENWTSVASTSCDNPDHFHCLKDEYGRVGWVCAEPIWVEEGRCPLFNVAAKKLDTVDCPKSHCPPYIYRSNEINVEYACRYTTNSKSLTTMAPDSSNESSFNSGIFAIVLIPIFVLAALIGIFIIRRRKLSQNNYGSPNVEGANASSESEELLHREIDTKNKEEASNRSFSKAKECLKNHNRVVITGIQGAGKTYLAKSLVDDLHADRQNMRTVWISNLIQLKENQNKPPGEEIFILDEIFYELQTKSKVNETFKILQSCLENSGKRYLIITMPSNIWEKNKDMFAQATLDKVHIDLNDRRDDEKRFILTSLMKLYAESREEADRICNLESTLLGDIKFVGFPAFISWFCRTSSKENVKSLMSHSLSVMYQEIKAMKSSNKKEEKVAYVILAYIALHGENLDCNNVDKKLFGELMNICHLEFNIENLKMYAEMMVNSHYLIKNMDGKYEFNLNILKKIVFVSVAEYDSVFIQQHCEMEHYSRYIITKNILPEGIEEVYSNCFITI